MFLPVPIILTLAQTKVPVGLSLSSLSAHAIKASFQPFSLKEEFTPVEAGLGSAACMGGRGPHHFFFPVMVQVKDRGSGRPQQGFPRSRSELPLPGVRGQLWCGSLRLEAPFGLLSIHSSAEHGYLEQPKGRVKKRPETAPYT